MTFADHQQVGNLRLVINNVGLLRYRVVFKGYVAALYLGDDVRPEEELTDTCRSAWSYSTSGRLQGADFGRAADEILEQNFSSEFIATLRARLQRLHVLYENVKPRDRYALTYIPGVGTELALNGVPKGTIEGADFAAAYFAIWLGEKPIDASLKTQLQGVLDRC